MNTSQELISVDGTLRLRDRVRELLPEPQPRIADNPFSQYPEVENYRGRTFKIGEAVVDLSEDESTVGWHDLRVIVSTVDKSDKIQNDTYHVKEYEVDVGQLTTDYRERSTSLELKYAEPSVDDEVNTLKAFLVGVQIHNDPEASIGQTEITLSQYYEVMDMLEKCSPETEIH